MARYLIADFIVDLAFRYSYSRNLCARYLYTGDRPTDLTVRIPEATWAAAIAGQPEENFPFVENIELYRALSDALFARHSIVFHASVLAMEGKAYAFTAVSGTGKSTHARMWREAFGNRVTMVNDDKPIFRMTDKGLLAYGTPWDGKHHLSTNAGFPLAGICMLERSSDNWIRRVRPREALFFFLNQTVRPREEAKMDILLDLLEEMFQTVPIYKMGCNISLEAAHMACAAMQEGEVTV